jgi:type IV pilus assembly protein PilE
MRGEVRNRIGTAQGGFTLMEVVIAMVIIAVLTAIAIPNYTAYVARGNRAEARANLLEAANWLERWRTERGRYDDPANANNPPPGFPWAQIPRTGTAKYTVAIVAAPAAYTITATATGTMAGDPCTTLSIDQTGQRTFTGGSGSQEICWNR